MKLPRQIARPVLTASFIFLVSSCYVANQRSIHKKKIGPITEDIFQYKSYKVLEDELIEKLKFEGRYPKDFKVDSKSLPKNGMVMLRTRKQNAVYLTIQFDKFTQKCTQKEAKDYVSEEKVKGSTATPYGITTSGSTVEGYNYESKTAVKIDYEYTLTCKPQLPIKRSTQVLVLDSAENTLREFTINPYR